jgi:pimeloyl-ACP methyl ester carboxylesterase
MELIMKKPRRLVPAYLAAFAISIYLLPQDHALAETLQVNGFEMHYKIIGKGEPLVLLHGFAVSGESWDFLSDEFANDFQLIIPDARGHGASTNPRNTSIANDQLAVDTYALLDNLEIKTFKAIGISMGGETLLYMATQQPERVEAMVLVGTANYWPESLRELVRSSTAENQSDEQMQKLRKTHKHGDDQIISLFKMNAIAKNNYNVMNFTPPYLSTIKADTLIVHGERDHLFPINQAIEMYKAIPESLLWIVPNGAHVPINGFYEEIFVGTAKAFLQGQMTPRRDKTIK